MTPDPAFIDEAAEAGKNGELREAYFQCFHAGYNGLIAPKVRCAKHLLVHLEPDRDGRLDGKTYVLERLGQIRRAQLRAYRRHAAADIDADGSRNDRAAGRDHAADGRPLAQMHIGHHGHMPAHDR